MRFGYVWFQGLSQMGFEICVADGDGSPERFDHINILIPESVCIDTHPDFLRMALDDERT
ncbi:hypothetical protein KR52_10250 [Synechococcus sp. KORDI-52]|nr:hypothetical protein KR52_10250 [Synechococcus sp. KORDI-52]